MEKQLKRISEVVGGGSLTGEPVDIDEILNDDVVVTDFTFRKSQFDEDKQYVVIQIEVDGVKKVFSTGSGVVLDLFDRLQKEQLPVLAKFERVKGKSGRKYIKVS